MKIKVAAGTGLFLALSASALFFFTRGGDGRQAPFRHTGTVEVVETTVSFQIPGQVASVAFEEGQAISRGQIMATLDTSTLAREMDRAEAAIATAVSRSDTARARVKYLEKSVQARISGARANLLKLESGLRPQEVESSRQNVEKATAEAVRARREADRVKKLYEDGVVPLVRWENAETAARAAEATLISARESLEIAELGSRKEDIQAARAALEAARAGIQEVEAARLESQAYEKEIDIRRAELDLAALRLGKATLKAPISGVILTRTVEPGENTGSGNPVATLADYSRVTVRFYVAEGDLGKVHLGGQVEVISDSYPDKPFQGDVSFISDRAEFTPKNILTKEERTKLVFMVKATVPNPEKSLKPGMPVDVTLER